MKLLVFVTLGVGCFFPTCEAAPAKPTVKPVLIRPIDQDLINAASHNRTREVLDLLQQGANPRAQGSRAFTWVLSHGNERLIGEFFKRKTPLPANPFEGPNARGNAPRVFKLLLAYGAKPDFNAMIEALFYESHAVTLAQILLDHCANINAIGKLKYYDGTSTVLTPLMFAAMSSLGTDKQQNQRAQLIKFLIGRGAKVNLRTPTGKTALSFALTSDTPNLAIMRILIENGAQTKGLEKQLYLRAGEVGKTAILDFLAARQLVPAHVSFFDFDLVSTPEMAKWLLAHGANPNEKNHEEGTPLTPGTGYADSQVMRVLLEAGANPNTVSAFNKVPVLLLCVAASDAPCVGLLLKHGANMEVRTLRGSTPLALACEVGDFDSAKLLFEHGANPDVVNNKGLSPRQIAASPFHPKDEFFIDEKLSDEAKMGIYNVYSEQIDAGRAQIVKLFNSKLAKP